MIVEAMDPTSVNCQMMIKGTLTSVTNLMPHTRIHPMHYASLTTDEDGLWTLDFLRNTMWLKISVKMKEMDSIRIETR